MIAMNLALLEYRDRKDYDCEESGFVEVQGQQELH